MTVWVAGAIIGALGVGGSIYAANKQSQANQAATSAILTGQQQSLGAIDKYLSPFVDFSKGLQPTLSSLLTPGGPSQNQTLSQLPGFQFASKLAGEGISAGAGRTGVSGSTAVEGGNLESALASQYFQTFTNPLLDLYRTGAVSASTAGQAASSVNQATSGNLAQLAVGQGNIQAGLASGVGGSLSNALLLGALTGNRGINAPNAFGPGGMFGTGTQFMGGGNWLMNQ